MRTALHSINHVKVTNVAVILIFFYCALGKVKIFKHIYSNEDFTITTALLGETERLSLGIKEVLERMICSLYKAKDEVNVNNARYMLFLKSKKAPLSESLPPTKYALHLHFDRVDYQCRQGKMVLNLHHELSNPTDHGWVNDDNGRLGIHWIECKPVLEAVLEFVTCSCRKSECGANQCGCVFVSLPCTDLCLCKSCKNSNKGTNIDIEDMFDEDIYDSNDEYSEDGYGSDEEENGGKLFSDDEGEP